MEFIGLFIGGSTELVDDPVVACAVYTVCGIRQNTCVQYLGSLPEPKLLDHSTKIRYISFPEVLTRYHTKKYLLGTKFFVADRIKLWRIDIRYLDGIASCCCRYCDQAVIISDLSCAASMHRHVSCNHASVGLTCSLACDLPSISTVINLVNLGPLIFLLSAV